MERITVKTFHAMVLALVIAAAGITSINAHDSFSVGINVGGYGYAPPAVNYVPPAYYASPAYYAPAPVIYYHPANQSYGYGQHYGYGQRIAPVVTYQFYNGRNNGYRGNGWGHRGRGHRDGHHHRGRRGWDD